MVSVLAMAPAGHLPLERRSWLAQKAAEYRVYLVNNQGEEPETARRRAYHRALNNVGQKS